MCPAYKDSREEFMIKLRSTLEETFKDFEALDNIKSKAGASGTAGTVLAVPLFWRKLCGGGSLTGVAYCTPPYLWSSVPCRDYSQLPALQLCCGPNVRIAGTTGTVCPAPFLECGRLSS